MSLNSTSEKPDLAAAIAEGDIRVLLMVLVHMTGDVRWLEEPFRPKRDVRLIPDPSAGLSSSIQDHIRLSVLKVFQDGEPQPGITDPGNELIQRMMSVCLGENVAPEYAPLVREEMGLVERAAQWTKPAQSPQRLEKRHVLIVGAGVCGIALGAALGRLGIPYTILERNAELGGTWFVNRYPGCGVDTPNHSYSYSFGRRNKWSRYFSPRDEIHDYLKRVAGESGVLPNIRFNTSLTGSRWDAAANQWISTIVTPTGREEMRTSILVSAIGQLNDPSIPHFDGAKDFKGIMFHSTNWPEGLDVNGKHVAVVGTGATAMQLVPTVVDSVASMTIYQRSPQWSRPIAGYSDPIGEGARWLLESLPFYAQWFRFNMFWRYGDGLLPLLRKDPDWPHPGQAVNKANDRHRRELTDFIHAELKDRGDLIGKCVPSYPPYGKRILLDNNWFKTLCKTNVELVVDAIDHVAAQGVVTSDGRLRMADIIVLSTGFKVGEMAARLDVRGINGRRLADAWADDNPAAYLGMTVPHFPNFFCMLGPNTGPAHGGSVVFQAECQTKYITGCLVEMIENSIAAIDIRESEHDDYVKKVDMEHEQLIWTHPGMSTYYRNRNGRVFSALPWRFVDYWAMTHKPDLHLYKPTRS